MKKLRRVTEAEVIAEFLKNEFYEEEFHNDRERFRRLVMEADVTNQGENAIRRALLFRRRGHMMRELPSDTQWWETELEQQDLARVRVFPRAQWRRVADGSFFINDIVARIRNNGIRPADQDFAKKIQALSASMRESARGTAVMLIGIDETLPFTILEGNHRMTAALLLSEDVACSNFRVLCGLSPRMTESCWYDTNLPNLWRYAKNRVRNFVDREADVERVLTVNGYKPENFAATKFPPQSAQEGLGPESFRQESKAATSAGGAALSQSIAPESK